MVVDSWVFLLTAEGIMMVTAAAVDKEDTVGEIMALEGSMGAKETVAAAGGGGGMHGSSGHCLVAEGGTVAAECLVVVHSFLASEGLVGAEETVAAAGGMSAEECTVAVDTVVLVAGWGTVAADTVVLRDEDGGKDMKNRDIPSQLCMPLSDLLEE
jgi:hypothetical protein